MQQKGEKVGLEAPNCWTRTRFLGVNPKDSTCTRLVLDTLRLVLDSYSQKVDSTHHYCDSVIPNFSSSSISHQCDQIWRLGAKRQLLFSLRLKIRGWRKAPKKVDFALFSIDFFWSKKCYFYKKQYFFKKVKN